LYRAVAVEDEDIVVLILGETVTASIASVELGGEVGGADVAGAAGVDGNVWGACAVRGGAVVVVVVACEAELEEPATVDED
jgi:hypothetical protein